MRRSWEEREGRLPVMLQGVLAGVTRAAVYARSHSTETKASDLLLYRLTDEEYTRHPFCDNHRVVAFLQAGGYGINVSVRATTG